jgi:NAD(P)-dependent dehydrogenase (short-subunit alcohol dehydrogenase family)
MSYCQQSLLSGKVALITGAAGGIGQEVVRMLAAAGAAVSISDLHVDPLKALERVLIAAEHQVLARVVDVTNRIAVQQWVADTLASLGSVDILVNVAGLWRPKPFEELTDEDWEETINANLLSAYVCCKEVVPVMKARRQGSIINFASTAGEYGSISPAAHYAAAKGGIIAFTKSLARELGPYNVRVNAVSPGPTETASLGADTEEKKVEVAKRTLLGRLGQPSDIAAGVLYLAGPAGEWVTGQVLRINGGSLL